MAYAFGHQSCLPIRHAYGADPKETRSRRSADVSMLHDYRLPPIEPRTAQLNYLPPCSTLAASVTPFVAPHPASPYAGSADLVQVDPTGAWSGSSRATSIDTDHSSLLPAASRKKRPRAAPTLNDHQNGRDDDKGSRSGRAKDDREQQSRCIQHAHDIMHITNPTHASTRPQTRSNGNSSGLIESKAVVLQFTAGLLDYLVQRTRIEDELRGSRYVEATQREYGRILQQAQAIVNAGRFFELGQDSMFAGGEGEKCRGISQQDNRCKEHMSRDVSGRDLGWQECRLEHRRATSDLNTRKRIAEALALEEDAAAEGSYKKRCRL